LTWVVRTVIIDEQGETVYDEQKESPLASASKKDGRSNPTKAKKKVRKEDGTDAATKRSVCLPHKTS